MPVESTVYAVDVADLICRSVSDAIIDGHLEPGTKLPEAAIGAHFGVSRTVVRSAMNRLQRERLVDMRKNHGVFVATPSFEEAQDLYDVRRVIERAVVERAATKITEEDVRALIAHTEQEDEIHRRGQREDVVRLSGAFHIRLAAVTGNAILSGMVDILVRRSALVIAAYGKRHGRSCGAGEHRDLVRALEQRNVAAASHIMEAHLHEIEASLSPTVQPDQPISVVQILSRYTSEERPAASPRPPVRRSAKRRA